MSTIYIPDHTGKKWGVIRKAVRVGITKNVELIMKKNLNLKSVNLQIQQAERMAQAQASPACGFCFFCAGCVEPPFVALSAGSALASFSS